VLGVRKDRWRRDGERRLRRARSNRRSDHLGLALPTRSRFPDSISEASQFSKSEREHILDECFRHWQEHAMFLKGYLALTLERMGRNKDARLVWESVLDAAKTTENEGTFRSPDKHCWLWYNDAVETHAFAIRTTMELLPKSDKLSGMVPWLLLNKNPSRWKSTRTTAEH
jgi:hypothetical protein